MRLFFRIVLVFLAVTGAVVLSTQFLGVEFGNAQYWYHHGFLFLIGLATFPRLTLLFSGVATGGWLWWLSWLFIPRFLVATLATLAYWHQNPFLVVLAWLIAWGGESSEKYIVVRKRWRGSNSWSRRSGRTAQAEGYTISNDDPARGFDRAKWVNNKNR